jgi:2-keto-4-pentenoate hydratase
MDTHLIETLAEQLWSAEINVRPIDVLSRNYPGINEDEAYQISLTNLSKREKAVIGYKLGYTSAAMRAQMGVDRPNFGYLTSDHNIEFASCAVDAARLIHPLVEPEIGLLTRRTLDGVGHSRASVYAAVEAVAPAIEIVDTRYKEYKFTANDNIADNSSSARFVLGSLRPFASVDTLSLLGVTLWSEGYVLDTGIGANALDDPLNALAWLVNALGRREQTLAAGSIVLTGGLTRAYPARAGQTFVAEFAALGIAKVHFR